MPKELTLPSREDIRRLPRWARVAFAARIVRRVQSRFEQEYADATTRQLETIDHALSLAESAASNGYERDHPRVQQLHDAVQACERLAANLIEPSAAAAWVALAAARAAEAAKIACNGNRIRSVDQVMATMEAAIESAGLETIQAAIHKDWNRLSKTIDQNPTEPGALFSPKLFGPR